MKPENIAYAAKINAACWLILQASKIAKRLADTTSEQQQAIEDEIAEIGHRLYREATHESEPEATNDPVEDPELEAYVAAVWELEPEADRSEIEQYRSNHGISPQETAKRWKIWKQVQEGCRKQ
jgi:SUMO ligase MMS21 Smc5/6 complex component